jgi:hypothetical protein
METVLMSNVIDPFLGLIGIAIPIGVAYVILLLQSRNQDRIRQKEKQTYK